MRIAVVGAGAMGSLFAARIALAGYATTLVDIDPGRVSHINDRGLQVVLSGEPASVPVPCVNPRDLASGQDLMLILTKFAALRSALEQTRAALVPDGSVLVLSNGLGVAEQLTGLVSPERLAIGVTDVAADLQDGVAVSDGSGLVRLGMAHAECDSEPARNAAACLATAGFRVEQESDMRDVVWEKVAFNAAFNALAAILDAQVRDLDNAMGRRLVDTVLDEVVEVARAEGVPLNAFSVRARVEAAFRDQGGHRPSMAQDLRSGRSTEIDALNGAIAMRGERLGVPVPANRLLTDLIHLARG